MCQDARFLLLSIYFIKIKYAFSSICLTKYGSHENMPLRSPIMESELTAMCWGHSLPRAAPRQ